jgi:hypothetical protein
MYIRLKWMDKHISERILHFMWFKRWNVQMDEWMDISNYALIYVCHTINK